MASPVPYDPTLQVAETSQPTSPMRVDASPNAFGAQVAGAIEGAGRGMQASGDELFTRALAMQTTNITAQANEAQASATDEAAKINAAYHMKQGNDAVQGYDKFQTDIRGTYAKYRANIDSPLGQKLFDQDSRRNQSYMITGGAMVAAREGKNYVKTTNAALLDQAEQQVFNDPNNEKLFNDNIQHVRDVASHNAALDGYVPNDPATKALVDNAVSNVALKRVMGMAKDHPFDAQSLFNRLQQTGALPPGDPAALPLQGITDISSKASYSGGQLESVKGLIFHHTGGGGTPEGVVDTLNKRGLGTQYVMDRDGKIYQTLPEGARGAQILPSQINNLSNANSIGIEVIAKDNNDVTPQQVESGRSFARAMEQKYGFSDKDIFGHGEVNPGHKEPDEGMAIVNAIRGSGSLIRGDKAPEVQSYINQRILTTGARQTAATLRNAGDPIWAQGDVGLGRGMDAIQRIENAPGNASLKTPTRDGDYALGLYQIKGSNLAPWLREAGMPDMTHDEFLADAGAQKQLASFKINQYWNLYHNWDAVATKWFTGTTHPAAGAGDGSTTVPEYLHRFHNALAGNASGADYQRVASARAGSLAPGNLEFQDALSHQLEILHSRQNTIDRETELDNRLTVAEGMLQPGNDGKLPELPDDLSPQAQTAFQSMNAVNQAKFLEAMNNNNRVGGQYILTPESQLQMRQAVGVAQSVGTAHPPSPEALEKFMDTDFSAMKWPAKDRLAMIQEQRRLQKREDASPLMGHAMNVLGPMFGPADFDTKDADTKAQFVGELHEMMQTYNQTYKKPPNDEDIKNMGRTLLAKVPGTAGSPWNPFGSSGTPTFQMEVPEEPARMIHDQWLQGKGYEPTDDEVRAVYLAQQYKTLYGKKGSVQPKPTVGPDSGSPKARVNSTPGGTPTTPTVPSSQ